MDAFKALSEPVKAGIVGAGLGAGYGMAVGGDDLAAGAMLGVRQGALAAVAAYVAPMLVDDKMQQVLAAGGVGAAGGYLGSAYVPGGALVGGAISAGALHLSRWAS
jgi:hypothetical protein